MTFTEACLAACRDSQTYEWAMGVHAQIVAPTEAGQEPHINPKGYTVKSYDASISWAAVVVFEKGLRLP